MLLTIHKLLLLPETLERMSQQKGISQESPSSPSSALRRQQTSRKTRETKVTVTGKNTFMKGQEWLWLHPRVSSPQTKGRMSQRLSKASEALSKKECVQKKPAVLELPKLKSQYGIEAWKRWVQWRQTQPNLEKPRYACKSGYMVNTITKTNFISNLTGFINMTTAYDFIINGAAGMF